MRWVACLFFAPLVYGCGLTKSNLRGPSDSSAAQRFLDSDGGYETAEHSFVRVIRSENQSSQKNEALALQGPTYTITQVVNLCQLGGTFTRNGAQCTTIACKPLGRGWWEETASCIASIPSPKPSLSPLQQRCIKDTIDDYMNNFPMVQYPLDGCYQRAADLRVMIKAKCNVEMDQIFLTGNLCTASGVNWGWHVTLCSGSNQVVDPALLGCRIVSLDEWVRECTVGHGPGQPDPVCYLGRPGQYFPTGGMLSEAQQNSVRCAYNALGRKVSGVQACEISYNKPSIDLQKCLADIKAKCLSAIDVCLNAKDWSWPFSQSPDGVKKSCEIP